MGDVLHASAADRKCRSSVRCGLPIPHHPRGSCARRGVVENGPGIDLPGGDVKADWLAHVLGALDLGTLRIGIGVANK